MTESSRCFYERLAIRRFSMTEELGVEGQNNFSAVADIHGNAGLFSPAVRDDSVNSYDPGISMKCQRCLSGKEARYRAYTDVMEIDICRTWVAEAQHLGISLASIVGDGNRTSLVESDGKAGSNGDTSAASKRYPLG
jgi:hypothetical protein